MEIFVHKKMITFTFAFSSAMLHILWLNTSSFWSHTLSNCIDYNLSLIINITFFVLACRFSDCNYYSFELWSSTQGTTWTPSKWKTPHASTCRLSKQGCHCARFKAEAFGRYYGGHLDNEPIQTCHEGMKSRFILQLINKYIIHSPD